MNAIRRDEEMDNLHSIYVDQWDWEVVISRQERNMDFLRETVEKIVAAICDTHQELKAAYPAVSTALCPKVTYFNHPMSWRTAIQSFPQKNERIGLQRNTVRSVCCRSAVFCVPVKSMTAVPQTMTTGI